MAGAAAGLLQDLPLVDAHCHQLLRAPVGAETFERSMTEADRTAPGTSCWDAPVGRAIRRWCAPHLDLSPLPPPGEYLRRRATLGDGEVAARLLVAAGLSRLLVDTGLAGADLAEPLTLAGASGAAVSQVVRLERVAEELAGEGVAAHDFADTYADRLRTRTREAVAVKSVLAYRYGFDVDPARPTAREVRVAAGEWLGTALPPRRLDHPVLLRFVLWAGVDLGLPVQVHAGFGDSDVQLRRADPAVLQPVLAAIEPTGVPVVLLHCYPYHRQAGWLAAVYPHVYLDVGLTVAQVGAAAEPFLGECLELAPLGKVLFSTDAYRLPELYAVGAAQFRHSLGRLLDRWVDAGTASCADVERAVRLIGVENAVRVYRL